MSLGLISGLNVSGFAPAKRAEVPNHWTTPTKSPNEVMKDQADKFIRKQEEKSQNKPAEERSVGDWLNVGMSFVKKFMEIGEKAKKY